MKQLELKFNFGDLLLCVTLKTYKDENDRVYLLFSNQSNLLGLMQ